MDTGRLDLAAALTGLTLRRVGAPVGSRPNVLLVETTSSTSDSAWAQVDAPDADGFVVFAEHQTQGRGRLGRRWESPRGASLLCSVLLLEPVNPPDLGHGPLGARLALVAAVAAHDAIAEATGVQTEIKWPNDLLVGGRKLGGVLVESRSLPGAPAARGSAGGGATVGVVAGIGINCLQQRGHFPPELRHRATSLDEVAAVPIDRNALASALLTHLDRWLADPDAWSGDLVRRAWLERAAPFGSRIKLLSGGRRYQGHVVDLEPDAALLVQLDDGQRRLFDAATTTVLDD